MLTRNGRTLYKFRAVFTRRDTFDRLIDVKREIEAVSYAQAQIKAAAIAKKNGWALKNLGTA